MSTTFTMTTQAAQHRKLTIDTIDSTLEYMCSMLQAYYHVYGRGWIVYGLSRSRLATVPGLEIVGNVRGGLFCAAR